MRTDDFLKEQNKLLKEILKWIKIGGIREVKGVLTNTLIDDNKKLVYHLTDGRSSDEIEKVLNKKITKVTVRNWWKEWFKLGIVEIHPDYQKRIIKTFELQDFGIESPKIDNKTEEKINDLTDEEKQEEEIYENKNSELKDNLQEVLSEE